jgi:nicotinate-nucleotide adenylyltransferase
MERIGLFGGTFDPVHLGHLLVAQAAVEELELARLFFIPTARSPFKPDQGPAPAAIRLRLLRLALAGMSACEVDEQEVLRGGISYTIDTVRRYAAAYPGASLHWVIGADHVASLTKWRNAEELASLVHLVVVPRPAAVAVTLPPPFRGTRLRGFPLAVSSSEIRTRVAQGLPVDLLTGSAVAEAMRKNRLYL